MGWTLASDIGVETAKNNNTISLPHKLATYMKQYAIWTHVITAVLTSGILTNLSKFETHFPCFISLIHILYRQNSFSQAKGAGYCKLNISLSLSLTHTHTHHCLPRIFTSIFPYASMTLYWTTFRDYSLISDEFLNGLQRRQFKVQQYF